MAVLRHFVADDFRLGPDKAGRWLLHLVDHYDRAEQNHAVPVTGPFDRLTNVYGDRFDYVIGVFLYRQTIRTQGLQVQDPAATARPETTDHFEVGLRTQFADRNITLNLTGLWTDVSDHQAVATSGQLGVLRGFVANADAARVRGIELDSAWRASDQFNLNARGAYTEAEHESFVDAPCPPGLTGGITVGAGQTPGDPVTCGVTLKIVI